MAATKASSTYRARLRIISFPNLPANTQTLFTFAFPTIRLAQWHRVRNWQVGSITRGITIRFCCSMPLTKPISALTSILSLGERRTQVAGILGIRVETVPEAPGEG